MPLTIETVPPFLPYGAALIGGLLGWRFYRSRAVFTLIALVLVYIVLSGFITTPPKGDVYGQVLYGAVALLLPLNMAFFAFMEERGIANTRGLIRLSVVLAQAFLLAWLIRENNAQTLADAARMLHWRLLPPAADAWTHLPQPALIAFVAVGIILAVRLVMTGLPLDGGLLGALATGGVALHMAGHGIAPDLFLSAAILSVTAGVVQDSYHMAFIDELTGLPGRRALSSEMKKLGSRYAVAMVDVDHFKKFNDTYGHDVGDQVLRMVASCLRRVNGGGKSFRYGGEEFTVAFPGKDVESAWEHLDDLRESVAMAEFHLRAKDRPKKKQARKGKKKQSASTQVSVTISIGVAERGAGGDTPETVLKSADQALYRAKNAGRNRVAS